MKIGDKVFVPMETNSAWMGEGDVVKIHSGGLYADLIMRTGNMVGKTGGFRIDKLKPVSVPTYDVVGGAPHGFGVWIEGKFHRVEIGALGKLITDLQTENAELKTKVAVKTTPAFEKFEDYFDIWDTTHDPEIRRLCKIVWEVSRLRKK